VFPANQTYSNGEVVRWIGPPDADEPASRVTLTAAEGEEPAAAGAAPATTESDDSTKENVALGFGIAGLVAGLGALAVALLRRPRRA
jgi:hypothetical protein